MRVHKATLILVLICTICFVAVGVRPSFAASFISTGDGGWEWASPRPQGNYLQSVFFLDSNTGWAVGYHGAILKTTNGGASWSSQCSGTDLALCRVFFVDFSNGWAVGENQDYNDPKGVILRTTDGGATWAIVHAGPYRLFGAHFVDANHGWAVGGHVGDDPCPKRRVILATTDGGVTWKTQVSNTRFHVNSVYFVDAKTGFAVGDAYVLKTSNGGQTWVESTPPKLPLMRAVCFVSPKVGWIGGGMNDGAILKTTDGGVTWRTQISGMGKEEVHSMCFTDSKTGWAAGGLRGMDKPECTIVRTTDGGKTWKQFTIPNTNRVGGIHFADSSTGWAVALPSGNVLQTTDGGATWSSLSTCFITQSAHFERTGFNLLSACFADRQHGWITQGDGTIFATSDGGLSWTRQQSGTTNALWGVRFLDSKTGWAVGEYGTIVSTEDGGVTWTKQQSGAMASLHDVCFMDAKVGWAVGEKILKTTDGGKTWVSKAKGTAEILYRVYFANPTLGWAVGSHGIIVHTEDGGETWAVQPSGIMQGLNSVQFADAASGWAVGDEGVILRTTDAGKTWTAQNVGRSTNGEIVSIHCMDSDSALAVAMGKLLWTTDGGKTWTERESGAPYAQLVCFTDKNSGWFIGSDTVLRTSTGGLPGVIWAQEQPDGTPANFGHLVVTKKSDGYLFAEHPDSRIGIQIKTSDSKPNVGDYIYIHGKIASENGGKIIAADSIDIQCAGWGILPAKDQ